MYQSLFVLFALLSVVFATSPILVTECGTLASAHSTYMLANDIAVSNATYGYVCFDITGTGITLNGNGFELKSSSDNMLSATGVRYSGAGAVVTNMKISNMRTGIHAQGTYGEVFSNTITRAITGIDVTATQNRIHHNKIGQFEAYESAAGIYVYFPAITPVDSYINITNNVISDIQGDTFALGISVYYATSVSVAHNHIYNLRGGLSTKEISVIHGEVDSVDNTFVAPETEGSYTQVITVLASLFALVASYVFFRTSTVSTPSSAPTPVPLSLAQAIGGNEKEEEEKARKEEERKKYEGEREEEQEKDGASVRSTMSFSIGTSPLVRGSSPLMRSVS